MATHTHKGFTIIEVVLFVTISGAMMVMLATGWTSMLNTQRYRDSVSTLQSFIQQQYNLVYNVQNARQDNALDCRESASGPNVTAPGAGVGSFRGTDECVFLGRYVYIRDGQNIQSSIVLGSEPTGELDPSLSESQVIAAYQPTIVADVEGTNASESELFIPWGATVFDQTSVTKSPRKIGIAILRSPQTGIAHTYIKDTTTPASSTDLTSLLSDPEVIKEAEHTICLDAGVPLAGGKMAVVFRKNAASQSSIESKEDSACDA